MSDFLEDGKRAKRTTRFSGDFQNIFKELDSSGDDDDAYGKKPSSSSSNKKRSRTKECPGCGDLLGVSIKTCPACDYQFTSKSMLQATTAQSATEESQTIRDRFPFEPEREEDGSLLIQAILGRRPRKTGKRWIRPSGMSGLALTEMSASDAKFEYEYLVKYKNMSHMHVQWLSAADIDAMSLNSRKTLARYLTKLDKGDGTVDEDGDIDPSYMEVERVIDMREEEVNEVVDDLPPVPSALEDTDAALDSEEIETTIAPVVTSSIRKSISNITSTQSSENLATTTTEVKYNEDGTPIEEVNTKSVHQIFQPAQRCRKVLEKIWDDPASVSFQEPVDTDEYEDYLDMVEQPMCLRDVLEKLDAGEYTKYYQYKKFLQDMRLIWKNCKTYNLYKSQIWHTAHAFSLMFERLYQAWVVSFSDGSITLEDPLGQPWEPTCRKCLGDDDEDKVILCDHCDAPSHIYCLSPPLKKVPEDSWMCKRCVTWFAKTGAKMLSAAIEDEARNVAETAGQRKVVRIKKKKYLVKWRGLSYRDCTWETVKDINDDEKIAEYHRLNDNPPDDPPLTQAEIGIELSKDRRSQLTPAMTRPSASIDIDATIYAQIRALHFLRFKHIPPSALLRECGPATLALAHGSRTDMLLPTCTGETLEKFKHISDFTQINKSESIDPSQPVEPSSSSATTNTTDKPLSTTDAIKATPVSTVLVDPTKIVPVWYPPIREGVNEKSNDPVREEVADLVSNLVFSVARQALPPVYPTRSRIPKPTNHRGGEIEICVRKYNQPLCVRLGENKTGNAVILGYKPNAKGTRGPIELSGRAKHGDIIVAVNGIYVHHLPFNSILRVLTDVKSPFIYLRLYRNIAITCLEKMKLTPPVKYNAFEDYLDHIDDFDHRRPTFPRSRYFGVFPSTHSSGSRSRSATDLQWDAICYENDQSVIIGTYDTELEAAKAYDAKKREMIGASTSVKKVEEKEGNGMIDNVDEEKKLSQSEDTSTSTVEETNDTQVKYTESDDKSSIQSAMNLNFDEDGNLTSQAAILSKIVLSERTSEESLLSKFLGFEDREKVQKVNTANGGEVETDAMNVDNDAAIAADQLNKSMEDTDFQSIDSRDTDSILSLSDDESVKEKPVEKRDRKITNDSDSENSESEWESDEEDEESEDKPEKDYLIPGDGAVSRLLRAVNQTDFPPIRTDWTKYIIELGYPKRALTDVSDAKSRRIDQVDMASNRVIETWESVMVAARMLNINPQLITKALQGQIELAGGFKWRISETSSSTIIQQQLIQQEEDDEEGEENEGVQEAKKEESWKSKLYKKSKDYRSGGTLRDYQLEGLNWLLRCWYGKRSSMLADEMGLGKTVQVISFLDHLFEVEALRGPFLVAVPLSTLEHWKREAEGWSHMTVCLYHDAGGGRDMRDVIREYDWYYQGRSRRLLKFHLLLTTYDDLIKDYEELAEVPWRVVVVDEAHRLRNTNSKLLECMRAVTAKGLSAYGYQHRILMTGTPLQNNTSELWSLLNFIEPAKFPDAEKFASRFGNIQTQEQVENLQRRLAPHLLRRVKEDVAKDIPPKEETIIDVELTTMQKQYYRAIFEHNHGFLMQALKAGSMPKLMNIQMELRKCCNHPFLINGIEQTEMEVLEKDFMTMMEEKRIPMARFDRKEFERRRMDEVLVPSSGKMVLIDKLLPKLRKEGHKVLIFSQMVRMIDLIEEYCEQREYPCERLDGRVGGNDRQRAIDRFNTTADSFVFLLSTRAGGVGINLTAADTVIIFDSDWNPQNDVQAMARCHRIGQKKSVTIYRLITRKSFEAEMFERASKKLGLEQAILGTRQFTDQDYEENQKNAMKLDAKEMEQLLREGAYAMMLDDDEEVKQFFAQDIDKILESRSHLIVTEGAPQTESWLNKKKQTNKTRKSQFTGDGSMEHADIDVNDPDFWRKVLPDLVTPETMLERLDSLNVNKNNRDNDDSDDEDDEDEDEDEVDTIAVEKFMKDLALMMEGMLDLNRRGQLPDREKAICMKLLLRITLKEDIFDESDRNQVQEWLSIVEGARRRNRVEIIPREDRSGSRGGRGSGKRGNSSGAGRGRGKSRGNGWAAHDDDDDDLVDENADSDGDGVSLGKKSKKTAGDGDETSHKKRTRRSREEMEAYREQKALEKIQKQSEKLSNAKVPSKRRRVTFNEDDDGVNEFADDEDVEFTAKPKKTKAVKAKDTGSGVKKALGRPRKVYTSDDDEDDDVDAGVVERDDEGAEEYDGLVTVSSRGRMRKSLQSPTRTSTASSVASGKVKGKRGRKPKHHDGDDDNDGENENNDVEESPNNLKTQAARLRQAFLKNAGASQNDDEDDAFGATYDDDDDNDPYSAPSYI